jgi:ATP-dependent Lon protease
MIKGAEDESEEWIPKHQNISFNSPVSPAFRESVRYGEQKLYVRGKELVGTRDPRTHEFSVRLCAMDVERSGQGLDLLVLIALCGALIERSVKGGLMEP